jgi:hypothetical protein
LVGKLEGKNHLEVLGVDGRILKYTLNNRMGGVSQKTDKWWALANTVMNCWYPYKAGNLVT